MVPLVRCAAARSVSLIWLSFGTVFCAVCVVYLTQVGTVTDSSYTKGFALLGSGYHYAVFDNFSIQAA